jgi:predicted ATP-dependent endonuclease of OLD family
MRIKKAIIKNYKTFKHFEISFNEDINIIIGNNEAGKTTLLEALHLALTCQIHGRNLKYELSPYFFNLDIVNEYIANLQINSQTPLPEIKIEIFFHESDKLKDTIFSGRNNSLLEDAYGVSLTIAFDSEFQNAYTSYIAEPAKVKNIPIEYYEVKWYTFSNAPFKFTQLPFKSLF